MTEDNKYPVEIDLSSCEKEPIHIIGTTQSHGLLIASCIKTGEITQVGENSGHIIGIASRGNHLGRLSGRSRKYLLF